MPLRGETGTLLKYTCLDNGLSDLLLERLVPWQHLLRATGCEAKLIHAAGESAEVVLSSSWRHERHRAKRVLLEKKIGRLGVSGAKKQRRQEVL